MQPTTREIIATHALNRLLGERCVEWASQQLESGKDTNSLRLLAGAHEPFNQFEMHDLVGFVISELGIGSEDREAAALLWAEELATKLIEQKLPIHEALNILTQLYYDLECTKALQIFMVMKYAEEDLQAEEVQWYLPGADRSNIDAVVTQKTRDWLRQRQAKLE